MDDIDKIHALLKEHGAVLERTKKHKVWRFPDGRIWVVASTPRSSQSHRNNYLDLCNFLGHDKSRRKNPERRDKPGILRRVEAVCSGVRLNNHAEQLAAIRKYVHPNPCATAMRLERFRMTPLIAILQRLFRRKGKG